MKKVFLYILGIYILFGSLYILNEYLKLPKKLYQISNTTQGLPEKIKVIDIKRDYDAFRDNNFFILADNNHIYQINPTTRTVIKDIKVDGLKNPSGFSVARFYYKKKYKYEIYIADTNNSRIVKLDLPLTHNSVTVQSSTFISLKNTHPLDVSFFKRYNDKAHHTSNNIAVLTDTHKIICFNLKTKQQIDSFDILLQINKQKTAPKNLPYFRYKLIDNWGTGPQLRRYDFLETIDSYENSSRAHISLNLGKISISGDYIIPDNDNKLLWICTPSSHIDIDGKIIRRCMTQRTIKYTKDINMAIKYGDAILNQKELFIVAYKNGYGLSYNKVEYGFFAQILDISEKIFLHYLIAPFVILAYIGGN